MYSLSSDNHLSSRSWSELVASDPSQNRSKSRQVTPGGGSAPRTTSSNTLSHTQRVALKEREFSLEKWQKLFPTMGAFEEVIPFLLTQESDCKETPCPPLYQVIEDAKFSELLELIEKLPEEQKKEVLNKGLLAGMDQINNNLSSYLFLNKIFKNEKSRISKELIQKFDLFVQQLPDSFRIDFEKKCSEVLVKPYRNRNELLLFPVQILGSIAFIAMHLSPSFGHQLWLTFLSSFFSPDKKGGETVAHQISQGNLWLDLESFLKKLEDFFLYAFQKEFIFSFSVENKKGETPLELMARRERTAQKAYRSLLSFLRAFIPNLSRDQVQIIANALGRAFANRTADEVFFQESNAILNKVLGKVQEDTIEASRPETFPQNEGSVSAIITSFIPHWEDRRNS